jgi:hypothetical protein
MEYRPWPLVLLAVFHLSEPLAKVSFYSLFYGYNFLDIISYEVRNNNFLHIFEFFFLFPLAGLALYKVKKWSFPVFIIIEIWVFVANWAYFGHLLATKQYVMLTCLIVFGVLNLLVVGYLLLPAVRIAYTDPRMRWWEAAPRYSIDIPCRVNDEFDATILNISRTGAFFALDSDLTLDKKTPLHFEHSGESFSCKGKVVHRFALSGRNGYGYEFGKLDSSSRKTLRSLLKKFDEQGIPRRPKKRSELAAFKEWLLTVAKTGKGLVPETRK